MLHALYLQNLSTSLACAFMAIDPRVASVVPHSALTREDSIHHRPQSTNLQAFKAEASLSINHHC